MGRKETEEAIADSRAGHVTRVGSVAELNVDNPPMTRPRRTLAELLAEAEAAGTYPLPPEEREWVDAPPAGREWPNED